MRTLLRGLLAGAMLCLPLPAGALTLYAFDDLQLAVAISQASEGDTIKLGPGNYSNVLIAGGTYNQVRVGGFLISGGAPALTGAVTIESLDPQNRAVINNIDIRSTSHWSFNNLSIQPASGGQWFRAVSFGGSHNSLTNSVITYGDATDWTASDWVNKAGRGVYLSGSHNTAFNNYLMNVGGGFIVDYQASHAQVVQNTVNGVAGDAIQAHGAHTLLERNLFKNFKAVDGNHDDCIQSFAQQGGVVGAGSVVGMTIRGNMCIANEDPADPFYSGTQGYVIFNGLAEEWLIEHNILVSSTYHGITLSNAIDSVIANNTVLDDHDALNGANTVWVRINGAGTGNEIIDNIANQIINNPLVFFSGNEAIGIDEYDDWFVDWRNYDFTLKDTAPVAGIGATPMNPGASFDPPAIPLPGGGVLLLGALGLLAVPAFRRARRRA